MGRPLVRNFLGFLDGVLDRLEGHEFAVVEFAVDLLHSAEVHVLDDVAGPHPLRSMRTHLYVCHLHRSSHHLLALINES